MSPARRVVGPNECWTHEQQRRPQPGDRRFTETRRGVRGRGARRAFKRSGPSPSETGRPKDDVLLCARHGVCRGALGQRLCWTDRAIGDSPRWEPAIRREAGPGSRETRVARPSRRLSARARHVPHVSRVGKSSARQPDPTRPENRFVEPNPYKSGTHNPSDAGSSPARPMRAVVLAVVKTGARRGAVSTAGGLRGDAAR
jgi:hypothetical protein